MYQDLPRFYHDYKSFLSLSLENCKNWIIVSGSSQGVEKGDVRPDLLQLQNPKSRQRGGRGGGRGRSGRRGPAHAAPAPKRVRPKCLHRRISRSGQQNLHVSKQFHRWKFFLGMHLGLLENLEGVLNFCVLFHFYDKIFRSPLRCTLGGRVHLFAFLFVPVKWSDSSRCSVEVNIGFLGSYP